MGIQLAILGYYRDNADINPSGPVQNLTAVERSPDDIRLEWDSPLNTGGAPIVGYLIESGGEILWKTAARSQTLSQSQKIPASADYTIRRYQHWRIIPRIIIG